MALLTHVNLSSAFAFMASASNPVDIIDIQYQGDQICVVYTDSVGRTRVTRTSVAGVGPESYAICTSAS